MNEGWQNGEYFILLTQDESSIAVMAYNFGRSLPGYTLLGLRGWRYR